MKSHDNVWPYVITYFALLFKISGYEFEVNKCVFCGSKNDITTFSFKDGGFVCRNCLQIDTEKDLNKEQMLLLRNAFLFTENIDLINIACTKESALVVLNKFKEFIIDSYGVKLKGFDLINK